MIINTYGAPIRFAHSLVSELLEVEFGLKKKYALEVGLKLMPYLHQLKDTCYLVAETAYVDKVYRDSFYHYFSSKLNRYKRDCIRISIFDRPVDDADFRDKKKVRQLQDKYLGFIVLRPTEPQIIGRSVISPKALRSNSFLCCSTQVPTSVNSIKLFAEGFPHSSQDSETISCAETTIWALMEYFSHRYPDYKPTLPSKIVETLNKMSSERQVPSDGLDILQMSFALKEFGFGTKIYSRDEYGNDFEKILSCYIESGIPLVLDLNDIEDGGGTAHAIVCIGHENVTTKEIDSIQPNQFTDEELSKKLRRKKVNIYDWDSIKKEFVFIDDNHVMYQKAYLDEPVRHYPESWQKCKIQHFIAPLYSRIYLEANNAKGYVLRFLLNGPKPIRSNNELWIRFYLASSRSYKEALALNASLNESVREMILELQMPKFVWIAELSTKNLLKEKPRRANGLVILDATEANTNFNKPLVFALYENHLMIKNEKGHLDFADNALSLPPFSIYNSLKPN